MHICLNLAGGGEDWMGGVLYIQNLARAIATLPEEEKGDLRLTLVGSPSNIRLIDQVAPYLDQKYVKERLYLKLAKELSERLVFLSPHLFNWLQIDFFYPTMAGKRSPCSWGGWIPDFQHRHLPELFTEGELKFRDTYHQKLADNASVVILSSQMAQSDFNQLYPDASHRSRLLRFASFTESHWFEQDPLLVQQKYQLPDRFFLICNQFWPHKNHLLVLDALTILKKQDIHPVIVCTGKTTASTNHHHHDQQAKYYQEFLYQLKKYELDEQVRILGLIPRDDQIQLMRRCLAVIQPSLFEGWSTVVEDARALGKSILLSDFPVHLEQNPPHSFFFQRKQPESLVDVMKQAWIDQYPGPDLTEEKAAREINQQRIKDFGSEFLKIARTYSGCES